MVVTWFGDSRGQMVALSHQRWSENNYSHGIGAGVAIRGLSPITRTWVWNQQVEVELGSVTIPVSNLLAECVLLPSTTLSSACEPPGSTRGCSVDLKLWQPVGYMGSSFQYTSSQRKDHCEGGSYWPWLW